MEPILSGSGGFGLVVEEAPFPESGAAAFISCGSKLLELDLLMLESEGSGSSFGGFAWFLTVVEGSEVSTSLSLGPGSGALLLPTLDGLGVMLGSFDRIPDAGAGTLAVEAEGKA